MAKTKKIKNQINLITIKSNTTDTIYIIDKNIVDTAIINFSYYYQNPTFLPAKDSDDLYLAFIKKADEIKGTCSFAVITIKDYYKYAGSNKDLVQCKGNSIYDSAQSNKDEGFYYTNANVQGSISGILGGKKSQKYNITGATSISTEFDVMIRDIGGNDTYTIDVPYVKTDDNDFDITDYKGNDKYTLKSGTYADLTDITGKDKYTIDSSLAKIIDYYGNDKYTFKNSTVQVAQEIGGNDTYTIDGNVISGDVRTKIFEVSGNDKYIIKNTTGFDLSDGVPPEEEPMKKLYGLKGVNDKYDISNSTQITILDYEGSDTYKLTNVETAGPGGIFDPNKYFVADKEGNEKYTISGSDTNLLLADGSGKDTYNIKGTYDKKTETATYVGHTEIKDEGLGKNTFNVNYGEYTRINTQSNINTFNIKNSDFTYIGANTENNPVGKDTYNLDTNADFTIYDYGASGDSYTLKKSNNGYVCDYGGNDKYTISNMVFNPKITEDEILAGITIDDRGGEKDSLTLKTTKKDNIIYMSDFGKYDDKYRSYGNSLIIYDKSTQGFVNISNFYSADENYDFTGFGDGVIETIKASNKKLDVSTNAETMAYLDSVKEDVVKWVETQSNQGVDFSCVEDVLIYGSNEQKTTLVTYFDGSHV